MKVKLRVHSVLPSAVLATEMTLKALPGGACQGFVRADGNIVIDADGWVEAESTNPGFLRFAAVHQGYVKEVS